MQDAGYELRDACLGRALDGVDAAAAGGDNQRVVRNA